MTGKHGKRGRWLLIALELVLAAAILYSLYWWRTRDLLDTGVGLRAPGFSVPTLDGDLWDEGDLLGRNTVLYFFAPWCKVCNASAHQLRWFDRWSGNDTDLVMVALDWDTVAQVRAYRDRHELTAPILLGDSQGVARKYRVAAYPMYYVIDAQGRIRGRDFGYTTFPGLLWRTAGL